MGLHAWLVGGRHGQRATLKQIFKILNYRVSWLFGVVPPAGHVSWLFPTHSLHESCVPLGSWTNYKTVDWTQRAGRDLMGLCSNTAEFRIISPSQVSFPNSYTNQRFLPSPSNHPNYHQSHHQHHSKLFPHVQKSSHPSFHITNIIPNSFPKIFFIHHKNHTNHWNSPWLLSAASSMEKGSSHDALSKQKNCFAVFNPRGGLDTGYTISIVLTSLIYRLPRWRP